MTAMKNIIVTGGSGTIGTAIAEVSKEQVQSIRGRCKRA